MSIRSICEFCGSSTDSCSEEQAQDCVYNKIDPSIFEEPQNMPHFRDMGDAPDQWDEGNMPHFRD